MAEPVDDKESWHLDKRFPLALIVTIIIQSGAAVWFAAGLSHAVDANAKQIAKNELAISATDSIEPRLVRVETDISYIRRSVDANTRLLTELLRESRNRTP